VKSPDFNSCQFYPSVCEYCGDDQASISGSDQNGCRNRRSGFLSFANDYEHRNALVRWVDNRAAGLLRLAEVLVRG
jgi:hypothetical protein